MDCFLLVKNGRTNPTLHTLHPKLDPNPTLVYWKIASLRQVYHVGHGAGLIRVGRGLREEGLGCRVSGLAKLASFFLAVRTEAVAPDFTAKCSNTRLQFNTSGRSRQEKNNPQRPNVLPRPNLSSLNGDAGIHTFLAATIGAVILNFAMASGGAVLNHRRPHQT
jgi:hypothetical protein